MNLAETIRYSFCDPGGSHQTQTQKREQLCRGAIVTLAVEPALSRAFVVEAWAEVCTTDILVEQLIVTNARWKPRLFGIESNAMQVHLGNLVNRECRLKGVRPFLTPISQPTNVDKDWRIESTLNLFIPHGRLFLMPDTFEVWTELRGFPTNKRKDLLDALASCLRLIPTRTARRATREADAALAHYLRGRGASPREIERRMEALRVRHDSTTDREQARSARMAYYAAREGHSGAGEDT